MELQQRTPPDREQRNFLATLFSTAIIIGAGGMVGMLTATGNRSALVLFVVALFAALTFFGAIGLAWITASVASAHRYRAELLQRVREADGLLAELPKAGASSGAKSEASIAIRVDHVPRVEAWAERCAQTVGNRGYFNPTLPDGPALEVVPAFLRERRDDLRRLLDLA